MGLTLALGIIGFGIGFAAFVAIGLYVTTRYPNKADPHRNLKRFTVPAGLGVLLAALALVVVLVAVVSIIVEAVR